jgi:6-phosphogluconolactonase
MAPTVLVHPDSEAVISGAAHWLRERIDEGARTVALSGGTTPERIYEELGRDAGLPWKALQFFFGDERCVAPDDKDSNYAMARRTLGAGGHLRLERLHRMEAERDDRDAAARAYERLLPAALDVVILGIGEDGHTASLFPGGAAVSEQFRHVLPIEATKPPPWRLTVTPPVIAAARAVLLLATGSGKADPVYRALVSGEPVTQVPSKLAATANATWVLDAAAAARLPPGLIQKAPAAS